jgi:ribosomal protein S18 acetylase RimI-like enzyme
MIGVRPTTKTDMNYILDIDLKCFERTWELQQWLEFERDQSSGLLLGTWNSLPVGFSVYNANAIKRLAVKEHYRQHGLGELLLKSTEIVIAKKFDTVTIAITESDNAALLWLTKRGYKARRLLIGSGFYRGEVEDEFLLEKRLKGTENDTHE